MTTLEAWKAALTIIRQPDVFSQQRIAKDIGLKEYPALRNTLNAKDVRNILEMYLRRDCAKDFAYRVFEVAYTFNRLVLESLAKHERPKLVLIKP